MSPAQSEDRPPELEQFAQQFDECIKSRPTRSHFRNYVAGQISNLPRKSVVPIAHRAGVPPRTLQEFLSLHRWDDRSMRDRLQDIVAERYADNEAIASIHAVNLAKKGDKTPGIHLQPCERTGKLENRVVTVQLGYAAPDLPILLDADVYLPEKSWHNDRERRHTAGIPDDLAYRPRWRMALDMLEGAVERAVSMKWLCADKDCGGSHRFRRSLAQLGLLYLVELPPDAKGWLLSDGAQNRPRPIDQLWKRGGPPWQTFAVTDRDEGPSTWKVRPARVRPAEGKTRGLEHWLLIARDDARSAARYFLSNADRDVSVDSLLDVLSSREELIRSLREAGQVAGFDHYEGRSYRGLQRHLILTAVSMLFLAERPLRLRRRR